MNVHDCGHVKVLYLFPDRLYLFYLKLWKIGVKIMFCITVFIKDAIQIFTSANVSWPFTMNYKLAVFKFYIIGIIKCSEIL